MKFFVTSTYFLMLFAVVGNGCAGVPGTDKASADLQVHSVAAWCEGQAVREFRNPYLRAHRVYSAVRPDERDANCLREEQR